MSRERHLSARLFYVSASGAIIAAATANSRRLSQQNPYKTCVSLVELGRTSRHFVVHFKKIPTTIILRYGCCALRKRNQSLRVGISMFLRYPAISGTGDGSFLRPPLAELGVGARSFVDKALCCHVGRAWRGRAAAGVLVAHGRASAFRGILKPTQFSRSKTTRRR